MRKIMCVTGNRAEYGILYHTLREIDGRSGMELQLVVTGSHLSRYYGETVSQIEKDGFSISARIDMLLQTDAKSALTKSMGLEMIQLSGEMERLGPDILLILGDRYEIFAAAACAMMANIPIAHISGGESTEGAIDEQIRHAITKMSHIHFPGAEAYREAIIRMGEEPWRVFNVGDVGVENIVKLPRLTMAELEDELGAEIKRPLFVVTYHPVTLSSESPVRQVNNLLGALKEYDGTYIVTASNADAGGIDINSALASFCEETPNAHFRESLGQLRYINLCRHADAMIGNSSSGIVEAPCFRLPVINIGDRQKGRLRCANIIDCGYEKEEISKAIGKALYDGEFRESLKNMTNPYGDGDCGSKIADALASVPLGERLLRKRLNYYV